MTQENPEAREVLERYARRSVAQRYSMLNAEVYMSLQERQRRILQLIKKKLPNADLQSMTLFEVGCGNGDNLIEFLRIGFRPENLSGIDLIPDRAAQAAKRLPASTNIAAGDAVGLRVPDQSVDIVFQSLVFSSLLSDEYQEELANQMWRWVKPGGAILWYDFTFDNPANADVRGVSVRRLRSLFPTASLDVSRVTLAPPISRRVCGIHPMAYSLLNFPFLRTHVLCWLRKG